MEINIREILRSDRKPKEQVDFVVQSIIREEITVGQVTDLLRSGSDKEKGTAAGILKFVSQEKPEEVLPHLDLLMENINHKVPRVKWGCPESIGHLARVYPEQAARAIPKLMLNLADESTVVRWCAAFALAEIAKYDARHQPGLVAEFRKTLEFEPNNGVRNVFLKALKWIDKNSGKP